VLALGALVEEPAWAGRPLVTEHTGTLDPGQVEAELSIDYARRGRDQLFLLPGGPGFNVGLLPRLEGTVATAVVLLDPHDGLRDAGFSDSIARLKYRVLDEGEAAPALMGAVTARLPTGDRRRGLGDPSVDIQALAVDSKTVEQIVATLNAGYTFVLRDRGLDRVNVHASVETSLTPTWSLVGEVVSEIPVHHPRDRVVLVRGGAVCALGERVRLDAAASVGASRLSPDVVLTIGLTVLLNR
jgi:hypothetical protein